MNCKIYSPFPALAIGAINRRVKGWTPTEGQAMGEHSSKAFTADKLKKFEASGANGGIGSRDRDKDAMADDYGRKAARSSDSSAFAFGGAAKKPSLGRAGRAGGGRVNRQEGGKVRDINKVSDAGPIRYGDEPKLRAKGGRIGRDAGGKAYGPQPDPDWRQWHEDAQGRASVSGGRLTPFEKFSVGMWDKSSVDPRNWGSDSPDPNAPSPPADGRRSGGRIGLKRGGKASKGKTVVNVIVGGKSDQQPPPPPPHPMMPPPPPPQAATGPVPPKPPMAPPMMPPGGAPMGPAGAPPGGGMPPGMPPGMLPGRASGGRINEKFGAGSGRGRLEKTKRENHGKAMLAE